MASAYDIVAIRSGHEVLLIGPRLSLATVPKADLLGEADLRSYLRDALRDPGDPIQLRRALAAWGVDTRRLSLTGDGALAAVIAGLVGSGRLRAVVAPDVATRIGQKTTPLGADAALASALIGVQLPGFSRSGPPAISGGALTALANSPSIQALAGANSGMTPEALAKLAGSPFVQKLAFAAQEKSLTTEDVAALARSPLARKLAHVPGTPPLTPESLAKLATSPIVQQIATMGGKTPPTAQGTAPEAGGRQMIAAQAAVLNVGALSLEDRLMLVLEKTVESDRLSEAAKEELRALLDPTSIGITIAVLAVWAGAHLTPFGYVADALMLGVGVFFAGRAALDAGKNIAKFLGLTLDAKTEADLDLAADLLAAAIALLSVKLFAKLISRGASGLKGPVKAKREKVKIDQARNPVTAQPKPPVSTPPPAPTAAPKPEKKKKKPKPQNKPRQPRNYDKKVENPDGSTTYTFTSKTGKKVDVTYRDGYPDFSNHKYSGSGGKSEVQIDMTGKNSTDFKLANQEAGFGNSANAHPDGYTWHHHQDGKTMQLVNTDAHASAPHTGGASSARAGGGSP